MNSPEPQFEEVPAHEISQSSTPWSQSVPARCLWDLLYVSIPLLFLLCVVPELVLFLLRVVVAFMLGWVYFLADQLPEVWPNRAVVVFNLIVIVLLAGGLHALVRTRHRPQEPWRAQWTCELLVMAGLLFAIGPALAGVGRQLVALAQLREWVHDVGGRYAARRSQSKYNLKQIGLALHNYHDNELSFPVGGTFDELGQPLHSWVTPLLPYIDQQPLSRKIRHDLPWTAPENQPAFKTELHVLQIPFATYVPTCTTDGYAVANYAANVYVLGPNKALGFRQMLDGSSNTIAAGEVVSNPRAWGDPRNWRDPGLGINASPESFGSPWKGGGCNMLFADGSVKFLSEKTEPIVLRKLASPHGGEKINPHDIP